MQHLTGWNGNGEDRNTLNAAFLTGSRDLKRMMMENMKMNGKDLTVTTKDKMDFTCPYCNARFEYEEGTEGVIFHAPDDPGFLPEGRRNQIWWLISYSLGLLMLGAILYKFIAPLV